MSSDHGTAKTEYPKVAVIVPVYNNAADLRQCIDSVLGQDYADIGLYLIDDGSSDESPKICDSYALANKNVHVTHKRNAGLRLTWQRGLRESHEPWVCFVDGDDWIEKGMISRLVCGLDPEYSDNQMICCEYVIDREWNHSSEKQDHGAEPGVYTGQKLEDEIRSRIIGNEKRTVIMSRCMKLIPRRIMERNLHYCDPKLKMGEDVSIMLPVLLDIKRLNLLPDAYDYHYMFRHQSMVHKFDPDMYENMQRLRAVMTKVLSDKEISDGDAMCGREYFFLFLLVMKNELRNTDNTAIERIRTLCMNSKTPEMVKQGPQELGDAANRLITFVMRKPTTARIRIIRRIFILKSRTQ
ncbi:MAG: glycosyltransferase family 2 protein [Clostridiales bacterium]|nr:glycosyltransferase family 2 protein [Clostridiales bacterium]